MTAIWLVIWALHNTPPISNRYGLNAYGIWLCIIAALDFCFEGRIVTKPL